MWLELTYGNYGLIDGAKQAEGLTVIIDVFRAFSLECYLYIANDINIFYLLSKYFLVK